MVMQHHLMPQALLMGLLLLRAPGLLAKGKRSKSLAGLPANVPTADKSDTLKPTKSSFPLVSSAQHASICIHRLE